MIEDVEELRAEFQARALCDRKRFGGAHIDLPRTRPAKEVTRRIAEFSSRESEGRGINPLSDCPAPWRSEWDAWNQVGTLRAGGPIGRDVAAGQKHIDGKTSARQRRRGQLPVTSDGAGKIALVQHRPAGAEGELIDSVAVDHMGGVPGAASPLARQAKWVLRRYLVAITAAVGAVVDLMRIRVICRQ